MKKRLVSLVLVFVFAISSNALAHSGRTDKNGGHWDRKNGTYHYHNGGSSGSSSSSSSGSSSGSGSRSNSVSATQRSTAVPVSSTPRPTTAPAHLLSADREMLYGKTNTAGINLRASNTSKSEKVGYIQAKGTAFEILDLVETGTNTVWYQIWYEGKAVYIFGEYVELISLEDYLAGR